MKNENEVIVKNKIILNLIQDLQRLPLSFINNIRGRFRIKYGLTILNNGGFTLIELLVVVLIIGILAAVAVPQYETAVWKARFSEVLVRGNAMQRALELYRLQGDSTEIWSDENLDISVLEDLTLTNEWSNNCSKYACYGLQNGLWHSTLYKNNSRTEPLVTAGGTFDSSTNSWLRYCYYESDLGKKLCSQAEALGWEDVGEGF